MPQSQAPYFANDSHALLSGMLVMEMMKQGVDAKMVHDEEGNYTDVMSIKIPKPGPEGMEGWYTLYVRILPPEDV